MSEPPGPRNYPSPPDGPMEPGPRQPPSQGGYQPQQPPHTGDEQWPQSETEYQQRPQPQTGYQQRPQPQTGYHQQPRQGYQQQPQRGYQQQPPYAPHQAYSVHQPSEETTRDAQAALAARMELGPEYSEHVAAGLAERVEELAALRAGELRHEAEVVNSASRMDQSSRTRQFVLGIVSLAVGVPITAISATNTDPGLIGVAISWLGIVGVNVVHARANRPQQ
ncbi:MAG TPA: hypothetical protein VKA58_05190 [Propionibacteriaceae bacterium]|nr:hypothetical protein [Propionibacteriaceae bacterium]